MTAWLSDHALLLGGGGVLAVVLLLPALEAALPVIGTLMPGQTAVVMGGMLAYHGHVPVLAAVLAALAGGVLGNLAGYAFGRHFRAHPDGRLAGRVLRSPRLGRALTLIEKRGGAAVFVGRFTAVLRTMVPTLCGISGMRLRGYAVWSVVSAGVWAPVFVLLGYATGPAGTAWPF
ncbi:DedA family protein [Streptomyces sp. NPDC004609]|uniref:DedA family protein n=1 Tax=Streptomyces sp. NPDC004609 TaxID=3364704 RepID=UPI0036CF038D